jgi:hypothetical protein
MRPSGFLFNKSSILNVFIQCSKISLKPIFFSSELPNKLGGFSMRMKSLLTLGTVVVGCLSCGKKDSGGEATPPSNEDPGYVEPPKIGMDGFDPQKTKLDLSGALGFAKVEGTASGQGLLLDSATPFNAPNEEKKISKVTKSRELKDVFVNVDGSPFSFGPGSSQPPEIYKSPTGDVYVYLPMGFSDWSKSNGGQPPVCNIFKASAKIADLTAESASADQLECVIWFEGKQIQPQFWGMQGAEPTLQFDGQGRIIARVMNTMSGGNPEIIRIDPATGSTKLLVNANIYVDKFFATPQGGLYYVGQKDGSSYFRYVDKNGVLQQIAESSGQPILFLPLPNDPNDKVLYVANHPSRPSSSNNWVPMEILTFNPTAGDEEDENRLFDQVASLVNSSLYFSDHFNSGGSQPQTAVEFIASCQAGGLDYNYSNNLSFNKLIIPEKNGDFLFVNSNGSTWDSFKYFPPGKAICHLGSPYGVNAECNSSAWIRCVDESVPTSTQAEIESALNSSLPTRQPLTTPIIRLTSSGALVPVPFPSDVQVKKVWKIEDDFFYLQSKNNIFSLKKWVDGTPTNGELGDRTLKFKFEIYSLAKSNEHELIFSGLDFNTNEFGMGYINLQNNQAEMSDNVKVKIGDIIPIN